VTKPSRRLKGEGGQALILVVLLLPVFFAFLLVAVDGAKLYVDKRDAQNDADAAALAATQDFPPNGTTIRNYLTSNGYSADPGDNTCTSTTDHTDTTSANGNTNWCYQLFGQNNPQKVEVRVKEGVFTRFGNVVHSLLGISVPHIFVHAYAIANANTQSHCVYPPPPVVNPDPSCEIPGVEIRGTRVPGTGSGTQGFTMAQSCNAIIWAGSANGNPTLGAMATNGGLNFQGQDGKRVKALGYNKPSCGTYPTQPGTPCTATAWGDPSDPANITTCVKTLIDFSGSIPLNWQVTTTVPTPVSTWTPSADYGLHCMNITAGGTFTPTSGPPGVYCLTAANSKLTLQGDFATTGDGYTFFALNGSQIAINSNGTRLKFYWPSACGSRPLGSTRPSTYTCFRTISGYDPQTMLYATSAGYDSGRCDPNAICIDGQNSVLDGDMFAIYPQTFPPPNPTPTTMGAGVFMAGGNASAGSGFIQSWWFTVQGNNGSYTGTGPSIGDQCVFTGQQPPNPPNTYLPTCIAPGTPTEGNLVQNITGTGLSE
jgi:hypothetical protein